MTNEEYSSKLSKIRQALNQLLDDLQTPYSKEPTMLEKIINESLNGDLETVNPYEVSTTAPIFQLIESKKRKQAAQHKKDLYLTEKERAELFRAFSILAYIEHQLNAPIFGNTYIDILDIANNESELVNVYIIPDTVKEN